MKIMTKKQRSKVSAIFSSVIQLAVKERKKLFEMESGSLHTRVACFGHMLVNLFN